MQYFARFAIANVTYDKFDEQSIKIVKKAMKTTDISDFRLSQYMDIFLQQSKCFNFRMHYKSERTNLLQKTFCSRKPNHEHV